MNIDEQKYLYKNYISVNKDAKNYLNSWFDNLLEPALYLQFIYYGVDWLVLR